MNYEEKYKQALERAKEMCALPTDKATMEYIFPELKENEDEKIRKEIMQLIQCIYDADACKERWIAWLGKQGKKLDPDKVIEWMKTKVYGDSTYGVKMIEQFKKDFGI